MPERSLILFRKYEVVEKLRRYGGGSNIHVPVHDRQVERLRPKLIALQSVIDAGKILIQRDPANIEPEYTIVLETAGDPDGLYTAITKLGKDNDGVEWLFELVENNEENNEDFYVMDKKNEEKEEGSYSCKLFCVLTNIRALEEILSLWNQYSENENFKFPTGKTGLRNVFQGLVDIHIWGVKERLQETGILEAWREDLRDTELGEVKCQIELFFKKSAFKRTESEQKLRTIISELGGTVLCSSCIEKIGYHALLLTIPRQYVERILDNDDGVELIKVDQVMFFRPTGQTIVTGSNQSIEFSGERQIPTHINDEPIVALIDGLPQERHPLLLGLLNIDDPDDYTSSYQINNRTHGTSMASLIAHGDLLGRSQTVARKIYVRPIMKPYPTLEGSCEYIPDDILLVDKIHEAVRRMFEPTSGAVASTVRIINLSIGISSMQFYNMMSPLARLLDWLSYKYKVLFIISAGNHPEDIDLGMPFSEFLGLSEENRDKQIIKCLENNSRNLRLLSPAECMNGLTVGSLFSDDSVFEVNPRQLLPCSDAMPCPVSALGRGLNRSIKPDILFNGGKNLVTRDMMRDNVARWRRVPSNNPPGILSATPIDIANGTNKVMYSFGTSNSTAMISHEGLHCYEILNDIFHNELGIEVPKDYAALLLKAMIVHGAEWGGVANLIRSSLNLTGRAADDIHKYLGYGEPNINRVEECARNRITLIGYGELEADSAHLYELPLPFDFHTQKIYRCLTVTMAYFTPIVATRQNYRAAQLWYTIEDSGKKLVPFRMDASDKAVARGTLQHEKYYSESAIVWGEDDTVSIRVNCRNDAGIIEGTIPYALFVSFEVAEGIDIDVYQKVINKIRPRVHAAVTANT